ncbi:MAG: Wzz/FepE/Etk N-terminal domain-containing protein, partial [Candidatus Omnitrophica bacterium]|nr:Wzz/FepE/Etk N-terminal domain-containing protein [Candidatus Omnitrophota bacterium]
MMQLNLRNFSSTLRLREYYYMIIRHKIMFTAVVTMSLCLAVMISFMLPKIYRADTVLLVEDGDILQPLIQGLAISPSAAQRLRTLKEEMLSWARMTLLVEKLKLDKEVKSPLEYERLIRGLRNNIDLRLKGPNIITLSFEGMVPKDAQDIVQTFSDIISSGEFTSQKMQTSNAIDFIQGQMAAYRTKLEEAEDRLRKFKEIYMTTLPLAIRTNEQIVALKLELNQLLIENTDQHPRVVEMRQLIQRLEDTRNQQMQQAQQ